MEFKQSLPAYLLELYQLIQYIPFSSSENQELITASLCVLLILKAFLIAELLGRSIIVMLMLLFPLSYSLSCEGY